MVCKNPVNYLKTAWPVKWPLFIYETIGSRKARNLIRYFIIHIFSRYLQKVTFKRQSKFLLFLFNFEKFFRQRVFPTIP